MKINNNGTFVDVKKIFINDNGTFKEVKKILNSSDTVLYGGIAPGTATYNWSYVDLGLPSGTLWADRNIGANTISDTGLYYQFGDIAGYECNVGKEFNWSGYKWCNGTWNSLTKYCSNSEYGTVDNKVYIDMYSDDAAYYVSNGICKIPTVEQYQELINYCTWEVTTINGISGYKVSRNGKYIFFPYAGAGSSGNNSRINIDGRYATNKNDGRNLWYILLIGNTDTSENSKTVTQAVGVQYGCSIRPVKI